MHAVQQQNARIYLDHQSIVEEGPKELLVEPDVFHAPIVSNARMLQHCLVSRPLAGATVGVFVPAAEVASPRDRPLLDPI
jgi:hypothetical protein